MRLVDISPALDAGALATRFVPPRRFRSVRFSGYEPDVRHPSQAEAVAYCEAFVRRPDESIRRRWFGRSGSGGPKAPPGIYLDGGFGVGKTHLLASMWHGHPGEHRAYLTFTELTAYIGFAGMDAAVATFERFALLCIDEFELDDIANTLMVVTFLRRYLVDGRRVAVTSNTLPDRLGEGRFSASEFRREIHAIATHFTELRIDGDDFRTSHRMPPLNDAESAPTERWSQDDFDSLLPHLRTVHPVQYGVFFEDVDGVVIDGLHPLDDQDDALRMVQFVDKLYDAQLPTRIVGCTPDELFDASFRNGGYRKKYGRAISRLLAMQTESLG